MTAFPRSWRVVPVTNRTTEGETMNVRLYDGTVRCMDHMDASSYESETTDPCEYCGSAPEADVADETHAPKVIKDAHGFGHIVISAPEPVKLSTPPCEQCGSTEPTTSHPWFKPNRHDDGYARICDACWEDR